MLLPPPQFHGLLFPRELLEWCYALLLHENSIMRQPRVGVTVRALPLRGYAGPLSGCSTPHTQLQ